MSLYNITGWSGGGRRPLTYNLRAGQFRNLGGCNVFGSPSRTVINNNFGGGYGYGYDYGYSGDSGVPSWMQWCMGGGMVMNFLGQMMQAIFPGKESKGTDGKGAALTVDQQTDLALYKQLAKDNNCTILGPRSDGSYYLKPKGKPAIPLENLDAVKNYIDENFTTEATDDADPADQTTTTQKPSKAQATQLINLFETKYPDVKDLITYDETTGRYKFNNKEYTDPTQLEEELKKYRNPTIDTPATPTAGTPTTTPTADTGKTHTLIAGDTWWSIANKYKPANMSISEAIGQLEKENGLNLTMEQRRKNQKGPQSFASNGIIKIPASWTTTPAVTTSAT